MKRLFLFYIIVSLLVQTACKSEFEKVRISGDVEKILQKAFYYYEKSDYLKAQTLFELVLSSIKGRPESEKAYYQYAYCHYHLKQYLLAAYYFKNFAGTYTNSSFREEASFMAAYSNYKLSPSYKLEQGSTQTAIDDFQTFVNTFPKSPRVEQCNQLIDELRRKLEQKAFAEGELYFNLRQYQAAVISFDNVVKDFPESPDIERVFYLIARSKYLLAENSVIEKKEERYNETIERCNDFLEKYANSKYARQVRDMKRDAQAGAAEARRRISQSKV